MAVNRHVLTVDLRDDPAAIQAYVTHHQRVWPEVLESLQEEAPHLAAVLQTARPSAVGDGELTLAWPKSAGFFKLKAEDPASKELIGRAIRTVTGSSLRLAYELRSDGDDGLRLGTESADAGQRTHSPTGQSPIQGVGSP